MQPLIAVNVTIPAGQSMSTVGNCTGGTTLVAIITPAQWDYAGGLTFQVSNDGTTFYDVFVRNQELNLPVQFGVCTVIPLDVIGWAPYIIIRAGPRINPMPQSADRVFTLLLEH